MPGDAVYFQGHAAPGMYARAYLEGRLTEDDLDHFPPRDRPRPAFRRIPTPGSCRSFWEYPTVSMGLGPLNAIYQARFLQATSTTARSTTRQRVEGVVLHG